MVSLFSLPEFKGEFLVGVHDIEVHPSTSPNRKPILVRIFYPTENSSSAFPNYKWLPSFKYGLGFGYFLRLPTPLSYLVGSVLSFAKKPVLWGRPLVTLSNQDGLDNKRRPVVIFSHGLGGSRTTYSRFCGNLAAHGLVVFAIEHRDGSASYTSIDGGKEDLYYERPPTEPDLDLPFRQKQLTLRVQEVISTIHLIRDINEGNPYKNILADSSGHTSQLMSQEIEASFKHSLDMQHVVVSGHSFGAATMVTFLQQYESHLQASLPISIPCGVLLDPWLFAVDKTANPLKTPVLSIVSEQFVDMEDNFEAHKPILSNSSLELASPHVVVSIKGSRHIDQSDFPLLIPPFLRRSKHYFGGALDPALSNELNLQLTGIFIKKCLQGSNFPMDKVFPSAIYPEELLEGDDKVERHPM